VAATRSIAVSTWSGAVTSTRMPMAAPMSRATASTRGSGSAMATRAPSRAGAAAKRVRAEAEVLLDRQLGEHLPSLRDVRHASSDTALCEEAGHVGAVERDRSRPRRQDPRDDFERHALAGPVQP
jgi:hypothetical protein